MSWKNNVVVELFFEKICQKFRSVTHEINPLFYVGCYFEYLLLFVTAWLLDSHAQYKCTPGSNKYGTGAIHQEKNFKVTQFNYNSNSKILNKMWKKFCFWHSHLLIEGETIFGRKKFGKHRAGSTHSPQWFFLKLQKNMENIKRAWKTVLWG